MDDVNDGLQDDEDDEVSNGRLPIVIVDDDFKFVTDGLPMKYPFCCCC